MKKDYEEIFSHLKPPEPPAGLFEKIIFRIRREQRLLTLKRRLMIFSFGMVISLAVFIPAFKMVQTEISESGFLQFFSLLFSDFGIITTYWRNFVLTLLETIPAMSLALLFATIFIFLESLKFWARDIKLIFRPKQLTNI